MSLPPYLDPSIQEVYPNIMTILVTYRCTAACEQCCFESNPDITGRLSLQDIKDRIDEVYTSFPNVKLIVFSGGEAFLLKEDLFEAVSYAFNKGFMTRIVTNGYWAKSVKVANKYAEKLKESGITEMNISTGIDHQKWVASNTVINAAKALMDHGIRTLIQVERDSETSNCFKTIVEDPRLSEGLKNTQVRVQVNSWMAFKEGGEKRKEIAEENLSGLMVGCDQIFNNIVVTPHDRLSACCGLTLEHIPEMKLGNLKEGSLKSFYESQFTDFLKSWIHVDGPYSIIKKVMGDEDIPELKGVTHICQACVVLHKNKKIRKKLLENYQEHIPEVMSRLNAKNRIKAIEIKNINELTI